MMNPWEGAILGAVGFFVLWRFFIFFRNPPRRVPPGPGILVSPADGFICYVKSIHRNEIPLSVKQGMTIKLDEYAGFLGADDMEYWLVGIYMSVFDVHYNRAPIEGTIEMCTRFEPAKKNRSMAGLFINLLINRQPLDQNSDFMLTNERCSTWIKGADISLGMIQIADKWIGRIIPFITPGKAVRQGEVVGLIRMGSQVDVLIPKTVALDCAVRQRVRAGETILGRYEPITSANS